MTLYQALSDLVEQDPDKVLFIEPQDQGHRRVSCREFLAEVDVIARTLRDAGVVKDQCVAVWLPNWVSACAWQFAASAVGAHVIGVNTRYNVAEVEHILVKARPVVLAVAYEFQELDLIGRARAALDSGKKDLRVPVTVPVPVPGRELPEDLSSYDLGAGVRFADFTAERAEQSSGEAERSLAVEGHEERIGVAFTTSGSTGMPKLAGHRESAVLWHAAAVQSRINFQADDVLVGALPFSGVFGFSAAMAAILGGAAVLMHPVFNERNLVQDMAQFGATHYVGADDMLVRIKKAWEQNPVDLSAWRWIGIADFEGKSRALAEWTEQEFGTRTVGVYGSSELFALTAFWTPDTVESVRLGGGGYPVSPDISVRAVDPLDDSPVADGEEGELQFHGPNVVDAYLGDSGEGAKAFTRDGWFRSGDLGVVTEDDAFVYTCRMGDVLRLKGFLVDPSEIEQRLAQHPGVHTAKVVGTPNSTGQVQAIGFVTQTDSGDSDTSSDAALTGEELRDWCAEELARFKVPSAIYIVDEMPTTAGTNGTKIRAATLREWAAERVGPVAPTP